MLRVLLPFLFVYSLAAEAEDLTVGFFYGEFNDRVLKCNRQEQPIGKQPVKCEFDNSELIISLDTWGWEGRARLVQTNEKDDKGNDILEITGFCGGSVKLDPNVLNGYSLNLSCLAGNGPPPTATGTKILDEWYSDLPWHQKLSTVDSNLIDQPFVLPYEALPKNIRERSECKDYPARCMLRYGIVNVMSMHRTDKLYKNEESPQVQNCQDGKCVEVKLDIYRYHTHTTKAEGYEADDIRNNTRLGIPSLGFGINEATIFAPWRPWYTGHYCGVNDNSTRDSVCYDDYFTTQLIAATPRNQPWIKEFPAIFWPLGEQGTIFEKYCAKKGEENISNSCSMYLGKVDWKKAAVESQVVACDKPAPPKSIEKCQKQVKDDTNHLDAKFNEAIPSYEDIGRYPWNESRIDFMVEDLKPNPFIGFYELERSEFDPKTGVSRFKLPHYTLPKECTKTNYLRARQEIQKDIQQLEDCVLNYEIHTTGFFELWKDLYGGTLPLSDDTVKEIKKAIPGTDANQYGRTMFLYAGVPEQHIPVSFKVLDDGLSIYDKIYNASIYTQYLPMINPGDQALKERSYTDAFWHAIFMSNHMNQTPDHFIRGIRGRTLWHNEYRANLMYLSEKQGTNKGTKLENVLKHVDFPAGFQVDPKLNLAPFHGNTCDSCHIRNGSGIPLGPDHQLSQIHVKRGMKPDYTINRDYTYSNKELPPMKMVLFDLNDDSDILEECDANNHTTPKSDLQEAEADKPQLKYYTNPIMNFYGNSFHVNQKDGLPSYKMKYVGIKSDGDDDFEIVAERSKDKRSKDYPPQRINISDMKIGDIGPNNVVCKDIKDILLPPPKGAKESSWPKSCSDIDDNPLNRAFTERSIGFMHLMGRRLGNTPMIEMMPDESILEAQRLQALNGATPGCFSLAPGTRSGKSGFNYRNCSSRKRGTGENDCYIGRWGWIGDRASLEDQVANAAHVEMNITSTKSYNELYSQPPSPKELVRYNQTLCGPADAGCQGMPENSDITEQEIKDMATYQRWIGIPNRSEYQVSSKKVQQGEMIFKNLHCDSCHVIEKIAFDYDDNMLPDEERDHLKKLEILSGNKPEYPFISYLGSDLLMHDMGYLSQVAKSTKGEKIRYTKNDEKVKIGNKKEDEVKDDYKNYVQKIRTPALKGLRFNRFVTDSNHNTKKPIGPKPPNDKNVIPGCDFLLHDGRACDAIEAAYLHDGPAIKDLKMIEELDKLETEELDKLRAFLYSL